MYNKFLMKNFLFFLLVLFCFSLQSSSIFSLYYVHADLLMILALCIIFLWKNRNLIYFLVFSIGILLDICSSLPMGVHSIIFILLAFLFPIYEKYIQAEKFTMYVSFLVLSTIVKYILLGIIYGMIFHINFYSFFYFLEMGIEIFYNIFCFYILYFLIKKVYSIKNFS